MSPQFLQIFSILFLLFFIYLFKKWKDYGKWTPKNGYLLIWVVAVVFSLFYISGYDYFGYQRLYDDYVNFSIENHMEAFYFRLADLLPEGYLWWRLAVWGGAAFVWILACREMKCSSVIAGLLFFSMPLFQYFYYLREALAMGLLILSICLLQSKEKALLKIIIAVLLLVVSFFLHKSIVIYIAIALLAWFVPFNKITLSLSVLLIPIMRIVVSRIASSVLGISFLEDTLTQQYGEMYLEHETVLAYNAKGYLRLFITFAPIVYAIGFYVIQLISDKLKGGYSKLIVFAYYIIYLFLIFWNNIGQTEMAIRFMETSCVPLFFYMARHISQNNTWKKQESIIVSLSVFYICFTLLLTVFFY